MPLPTASPVVTIAPSVLAPSIAMAVVPGGSSSSGSTRPTAGQIWPRGNP